MAIAHDSTTTVQTNATSPLTFSHTCTGSDLVLFVTSVSNTSETTTGVTYNGVAMTKVGEVTDTNGPTQYLWVLFSPSTGANDVVVTNSGGVMAGGAASYTGVDQGGLDASSNVVRDATTTSFAASLSTVVEDCWVICTSRTGGGLALTAGANTVMRAQPETTYLGSSAFWDTGAAQGSPGSKTMTVTCTSQFFGGQVMASFAPSSFIPRIIMS